MLRVVLDGRWPLHRYWCLGVGYGDGGGPTGHSHPGHDSRTDHLVYRLHYLFPDPDVGWWATGRDVGPMVSPDREFSRTGGPSGSRPTMTLTHLVRCRQ